MQQACNQQTADIRSRSVFDPTLQAGADMTSGHEKAGRWHAHAAAASFRALTVSGAGSKAEAHGWFARPSCTRVVAGPHSNVGHVDVRMAVLHRACPCQHELKT